jgi:hypothetical protein
MAFAGLLSTLPADKAFAVWNLLFDAPGDRTPNTPRFWKRLYRSVYGSDPPVSGRLAPEVAAPRR